MRKFFSEFVRRNVHKVVLGYLAVGWLLTEVMTTALPAIGAPDWVGKLVLLIFVLGLPFAAWFSWEFEVTPEGLKRTHEVEPGKSITEQTGQRLNKIIIGVLVAAVALLLVDRFLLDKSAESSADVNAVQSADAISSIAVLPFADFSESADQAYIGNGIADTILHLLAQVPDLKVAARTSSFSFQGKDLDIATIASELGVGAVLEGSVQKSGNKLRVIAQLIRASDQSHLWSQTFNNTTDNVFEIQDEIAQSVLQALRPAQVTTDAPTSERTDVAAYEHYLKGKELRLKYTAESVEAAVRELQAATLIDPDFVLALVELGSAYQDLNRVTPITWAEIEPLAEASLRRAVQVAPDDPKALAALGAFIFNAGYEPLKAGPLMERALELNPNDANALSSYGGLLNSLGEFSRATERHERAYTLDPNNPERAYFYGFHLSNLGRFDEARAVARRLLDLRPNDPIAYAMLAEIASDQGRYDLAIRHALDQRASDPDSYSAYYNLATYYAALDDQETAMDWYQRVPNPTDDYIPDELFLLPDQIHRELQHRERDLQLYSEWVSGQRNYIQALFLTRQFDAALAAVEKYEDAFATAQTATGAAVAGVMAARAGKAELSERLLALARARTPKMLEAGYLVPIAQLNLAMLALADDDLDATFDALNKVADSGVVNIRYLRMHPVFDPLRDDPRFDAMMTRLKGKLDAQRERLRKDGL